MHPQKRRIFRSYGLLFAAFLALAWCTPETPLFASQGGTGGGPLAGTLSVKVVEAGTDDGTGQPLPIPGAFVMVGLEEGDPFLGNFGTTNAQGEITFSHPSLMGPQHVTAGANGYRFYSFLDVDAAQVVLPLSLRSPSVSVSNVTGSLTSFSGVDCDNWLQLAIVMPALSMGDLMGFDIQGQMTQRVPLDLMGDTVYVPGNLVIPSQKENPYLWCALFGVEIVKSTYQLSLPTGSTQNLFSFGAETDLGALLGGTFDLSSIRPLELGVARNVTVTGNMTVNISMASALSLNLGLITANTPADSTVMLLSLGEINGDPTRAPGAGDIFLLDFDQVAGGGTVGANLFTTPRVAPLGDIRYLSMGIATDTAGLGLTGVTGQMDRSDYTPPDTRWLSTFFRPLRLDPVSGNLFSFSDVRQPGVSPTPDLHLATLSHVVTVPDTSPGAEPGDTVDITDTLWTLAFPGENLAFELPILPAAAPSILPFPENTPDDDRLVWGHTVLGLTLDPSFDMNQTDLSAFVDSFTHFSSDTATFSVDADADGIHLFQDNCPSVDNEDQADLDGDGLGDACDTDQDGDGYPAGVDCDDRNEAVNPGATEVCNDGIDNDCDGLTDLDDTTCYSCTDQDGDGYYVEGGNCGPQDCQDGNPAIHPGVAEVCHDGIDNDCDGLADDLDPECIPTCTDLDGDDFFLEGGACGPVDCNDANPFVYPGAREACDGIDNDCNPATGDGTGEPWLGAPCDGPDADLCGEGTLQCHNGTPTCTDTTGDNLDLCDGMDSDCNPATADGAHEAWLGAPCDGPDADLCLEGAFVCVDGVQACTDDTGDNLEHCDGIDNDCNPATPDGADDNWVGALCDGPDADFCPEGTWQCIDAGAVCTDDTGDNVEICDGADNDCDGYIPIEEEDADGDGYRICEGDCDDRNGAVHPGARELCSDGIDNNCDGVLDTDDPNCDPGTPAWGTPASTLPLGEPGASDAVNSLGVLLFPLMALFFLKGRDRRPRGSSPEGGPSPRSCRNPAA